MNLGLPEVILILIVILIFVGPKKLQEAGEALGKAMRSFRRAFSGDSAEKKEQARQETDGGDSSAT